ncbi:MAG: tyrosine-type recombinase/integrase, partial [Limisphaerales bacterium]
MTAPNRVRVGDRLYKVGQGGDYNRYVFRFVSPETCRTRELSLGPTTRSLVEVEADAVIARQQLHAGLCPVALRVAKRAAAKERAERLHPKRAKPAKDKTTLKAVVAAYLAANEAGWSFRHAQHWRNSLAVYCEPLLARPVAALTLDDLSDVLRPIWRDKPETARRLRARLAAVMDFAVARGLRQDNPANLKTGLGVLLGKQPKACRNMPALSYKRAPDLLAFCLAKDDATHLALAFALLTACRTNEVLGARQDELDLLAQTFTVPSARSKTGRPHVVPLTTLARRVVNRAAEVAGAASPFLFARVVGFVASEVAERAAQAVRRRGVVEPAHCAQHV